MTYINVDLVLQEVLSPLFLFADMIELELQKNTFFKFYIFTV
jgi:hypothetical protein